MGFFKKIGKGIKKFAKKNINFKTLVKVGGMVDPSGIVSGMQESHYLKKEGKKAEAEAMAQETGANAFNYVKDNTLFGSMFKGATGEAGATAVDSSISTFFKNHWLKLVGGVVAIVVLVKVMRRPEPRGRFSRR